MKKLGRSDRSIAEAGSRTFPEKSQVSNRHHRLAGNLVSLYLLQGLNYVIPIVVLPYLVRVLGMERYGLIAFAQSFAQYFTVLTDYGFNFSATRSIAQRRDDQHAVSRIFCSVFLIKLILMCVGAALLAVIVLLIPRFHQSSTFFFVAYLAVIGNVFFPVWYFQGIEKMKHITVIMGCARLLGMIALFVFVRHPHDALLALAIQSLALVVGGIAGIFIAFRRFHVRLVQPTVADLRAAFSDGLHLFISTAAITLYTNTNIFLVGLLAGNLEAGYFSAADKLVRAAQGLLNPVTQAVFPHMTNLAAQSRAIALRLAQRILRWTGSIAFLASLFIFVLAHPIVNICFGLAANGSIPVLRWLAALPFLVAISNVLGVQTMITFGLDKQFSRVLISAGVVNVVLGLLLVHLFAAQGAAASVLCTECFVTVSMIVVLDRHDIRIFRFQKNLA